MKAQFAVNELWVMTAFEQGMLDLFREVSECGLLHLCDESDTE